MAEKNRFDMTKLMFQIMCVTVVQWPRSCLRADKPGSTPRDAAFSFFVSFFSHYFFFCPFFLFSYCRPCWSCTWINIYLKLKSGVLFWKRDFKSFWSAHWPSLRPDTNHKLSTPSSETAEFFSMLVDILTNNTQYTTNCTNLHPTTTSDPLAKVKLAFCTSS